MIPFRDYHLLSLLNSFDDSTLPIDLFVSIYFRANKALGSKDRAYISETVFALIRYKGLLDALLDHPSWNKRFELFKKLEPIQSRTFNDLPPHQEVSFPKELFDLLVKNYGLEEAKTIARASNTKAPTTVRVNTLKISRDELLKQFTQRFQVVACKHSSIGITFLEKIHFYSLPEFKEGFFEVQDEASQLVSFIGDIHPSDLVLDFCSGAGGKALAIATAMDGKGQLYLHDVRKKALQESKERFKRAGIQNFQILHAEETNRLKLLKKKMDLVFVDAPCSGTGTLRRNPDMKWRFTPQDLQELIGKQRTIFEKALSFLKPNGTIVFATCSLLHEENEEQVIHFQKTYNLQIVKTFKSLPKIGEMDGFFATSFKKNK